MAGRRLVIIGAGPIGLEAALLGVQSGYEVHVFEKGRVGEHVQRWGHVKLFSQFGMNSTPAGRHAIQAEHPQHVFPAENECITGRQHFAAYLDPLAKTKALKECLHPESQVLHVGRQRTLKTDDPGDSGRAQQPFILLIREKGKERQVEADVVLDCSGTYGQHRWLGDGGIPALGELAVENQVSYGLEDVLGDRKGHFAGKTTLVVGGGYSAATTVANLAELAKQDGNTWVIWLARTASTQPLKRMTNDPFKERDKLAVRANTLATRNDANVEFHGMAAVRSIEALGQDKGYRVTARLGKQEKTWEVDRIVGNVGYAPDNSLYRELQLHESYLSQGPMKLAVALAEGDGPEAGHSMESLRTPEPNFFILGAKSYGRNGQFLLRVGFEQVRDVFNSMASSAAGGPPRRR